MESSQANASPAYNQGIEQPAPPRTAAQIAADMDAAVSELKAARDRLAMLENEYHEATAGNFPKII